MKRRIFKTANVSLNGRRLSAILVLLVFLGGIISNGITGSAGKDSQKSHEVLITPVSVYGSGFFISSAAEAEDEWTETFIAPAILTIPFLVAASQIGIKIHTQKSNKALLPVRTSIWIDHCNFRL